MTDLIGFQIIRSSITSTMFSYKNLNLCFCHVTDGTNFRIAYSSTDIFQKEMLYLLGV